jgi:hypothetical protein
MPDRGRWHGCSVLEHKRLEFERLLRALGDAGVAHGFGPKLAQSQRLI